MRKILIATAFFSFFLIFTSLGFAGSIGEMALMTEQYPPYNLEEKGELKGISVDLMDAMLKKVKSSQSMDDIKLLPWANGYKKVQEEPNTCLFSMTRTEQRDPLFKWVGPILPTTIVLTAKKSNNIKINAIEDVNQYKIGVINDDIGEQLLIAANIDKRNIDGTSKLVSNIKKLDKGRIDLISYEENVTKWEMKSNGFDPAEYETVYVLKKGQLYFAFHKATDKGTIEAFQTALDQLKQNGEFDKITAKYLQ